MLKAAFKKARMYPHRIHLRGPWEYQPICRSRLKEYGTLEVMDAPLPRSGSMMLPSAWHMNGLDGFHGTVLFRRSFRWPKPLLPFERLWLRCQGADAHAAVQLNGQTIGEHSGPYLPFEFDITPWLAQQNTLEISVTRPHAEKEDWLARYYGRGHLGPGGGLWGTVSLEVRPACWLDVIRVFPRWNQGKPVLELNCRQCGTWPRTCSLSVRLAKREVFYLPQLATDGQAIESVRIEMSANEVKLWQPGDPHLYDLSVHLIEPGFLLFQLQAEIGFCDKEPIDASTWQVNGTKITIDPVRLAVPAFETNFLRDADRKGAFIAWQVPRFGMPDQKQVIAERLGHHPSLLLDS